MKTSIILSLASVVVSVFGAPIDGKRGAGKTLTVRDAPVLDSDGDTIIGHIELDVNNIHIMFDEDNLDIDV